MLEVTAQDGGGFQVKELFRLKAAEFGSEQQTPIFWQGNIYGVQSKDAGPLLEQLICLDADTGRLRWASGREHRFGPYGGPYLIADGLILVVNDSGVLTLADALPTGYHSIWQGKLLEGGECWAPMALAGGRLLVRDLTRMVCLDIGKK